MREIKFRAWNERKKEMITPYFFVNDENFITQYGSCKPDSVMQFTGLQDKNGVDIYEGDVVAVNESHKLLSADFGKNKRLVQWRELGACMDMLHVDYLNSKRKVGLTFDNGMVDSIEVIGNIHENPELLESNHE